MSERLLQLTKFDNFNELKGTVAREEMFIHIL